MKLKSHFDFNVFMLFCAIMIKKINFGILAGIPAFATLLFIQPIFAVEVPLSTAEEVSLNFITYLDENFTISHIEHLEESGETVGYLVSLTPQGYILVAGDTIRIPIKAYSLTSNFDTLPPAYVNVLLNELKVEESLKRSGSGKSSGKNQPEEINRSYWEFITQPKIVSRKSLRSYKPDTFLLKTKWNQGYPYNKFNTKVGDTLTVTGCVQTALAQVMRYHQHPSAGSGVFNWTWSGKTLTAVMNRPFNWSEMPESLDATTPQYQQDEVAALMRDLGVLNEASFGTSSGGGTGATFDQDKLDQFQRAFSYAPVQWMDNSDEQSFFNTIKGEIDNERPILLVMYGEPLHMTVADGYASDGSGKKIHVNLGWGGSYDSYYYLDISNTIGKYRFIPTNLIYYNIKPCQGDECTQYTPLGSGKPPVIGCYQNGSLTPAPDDMVIDKTGTDTLRIEAYDPDGDTVTLSATSSSNSLQSTLDGNLLTLTPTSSNIFCKVTIRAQSYDGTAEKIFNILVLDEMVYIGSNYNIGGQFADGTEIDHYNAYLGGNTTIIGDRGYSNGQFFYVWINDIAQNTVVQGKDSKISQFFTPGIYTVYTSLKYTTPSGVLFSHNYDSYFSRYNLNLTCSSLTQPVSDLAASMGIALSDDNSTPDINMPTVETGAATSVTQNGATLNGKVNPKEVSTTYSFEYGTTIKYGTSTPTANAGSGSTNKNVTADLTELTADTTYHFRLIANNSGGNAYGSDQTFRTTQQPGNAKLSVSPSSQSVPKGTGTTTISISNSGTGTMAWRAAVTSGSQWLSIKSGVTGSNSGTITVSYSANTTSSSRTATIRVTATDTTGSPKEVTVTQSSALSPLVITGAAKSITITAVTLTGTIKPNGGETDCYFEYGTTREYGDVTDSQSSGSGSKSFAATASLTDLSPATTYHFRVVATNNDQTIYGSDKTFTTAIIKKPVVTTGKASLLTSTTATLNGTVKPNGTETDCYFEYGITKEYGDVTDSQSAGSNTKSFTASDNSLTDLSPATLYHFRLVATNSGGTTYGSDKTFSTAALPKPIVTTGSVKSITITSVTLTGTVKPNGGETDCYFEYGTTREYGDVTDSQSSGSGSKSFAATASLTDLSPGTTYHFRVVAANDDGTSYGRDKTFTTAIIKKPVVTTEKASLLTSTTATLNGTVKPNGTETDCYFEYGITKEYGDVTDSQSAGSNTKSFTASDNSLTDLFPATLYHCRLVATNSGGTTYGSDKTFKTLP